MTEHLPQIIVSLLDQDAYKPNMCKVLHNQFSDANAVWEYKNRDSDTRKFTLEMIEEIKYQIKLFCELKFTDAEFAWMKNTMTWLGDAYITTLKQFHPEYEWYDIGIDENNQLYVRISGAPQYWTEWCETPTMAIISEVWFRMALTKDEYEASESEQLKRTEEKINKLISGEIVLGPFSDFGTRRRFSRDSFDKTIGMYVHNKDKFKGSIFVGTSNMWLAMKYGIKPVGTMAHSLQETIGQGYQEFNPAYANKRVMNAWVKEYGIKNGIYLTDCLGTDLFLKDFTEEYATLFSGVRHDSGDPYVWAEKMIAHYISLGIDPKSKTLLFSDGLDFNKAAKLYNALKDRVNVAFGIGTFIACDTNVKHMNQVLKVVEVNGKPVAKLSDVDGKNMCKDPEYIDYLKRTIKWRIEH